MKYYKIYLAIIFIMIVFVSLLSQKDGILSKPDENSAILARINTLQTQINDIKQNADQTKYVIQDFVQQTQAQSTLNSKFKF